MGRLGGFSEAAWKRVLAFSSHLVESLALLGGALKPRVDWRTNLRRHGGVSELPCRFVLGLGHGIAFIVDFQKDFQQSYCKVLD